MAVRSGYFVTGRLSEVLFGLNFTWIALVGMACVAFFFMDMGSLAARLIDRLAGSNFQPRFFDPRKSVPVTLVLLLAVVLYSYYEALNVRRVDLVIETSKLPEGMDRLRLTHLTDIHFGGLYTAAHFRRVMDIVLSSEPDILVMTGDVVDGDMSFWEEETKLLASHGAKYGAFAVTGNHEFYRMGIEQTADWKRRAGFVFLRDARVDVAGIAIIGLDDRPIWGMSEPDTLPTGLYFPEDRFVFLLRHKPRVIEGTEGKFDLQLSGHTHGGLVRIPGLLNGLVAPGQGAFPKQAGGVYQHGDTSLVISRGLSRHWLRPRVFTRPEVVVIELMPS
jgi:predicted MPP superfamily phosphohydrolase